MGGDSRAGPLGVRVAEPPRPRREAVTEAADGVEKEGVAVAAHSRVGARPPLAFSFTFTAHRHNPLTRARTNCET